jgi:dTDP-4-dehydrorhamnose reductase
MGRTYKVFSSGWTYFMNSVLVIGSNGQLGTDLIKTFQKSGWKVKGVDHNEISVERIDSVSSVLKKFRSDWIINTAAFHKVEECEKNSQIAWEVNALGPYNVSSIAKDLGALTLFISSDYVYSGNKGVPYNENDHVSPINIYGHSKAGGEAVTLATNPNNLVVRIAGAFGSAGSRAKGGNFVETILNKAKKGEQIKIVEDIFFSPTYTLDASKKVLVLLENSRSGIFNISNSGFTSFYEFAKHIIKLAGLYADLLPINFDQKALPKRPMNSSLDVTKVEKFLNESPNWLEGLQNYLIEKGYF